MQRAGLGVTDHTCAITAWTSNVRTFVERGAQPLARQLHQPKTGNFAHLDASAVKVQRITQTIFNSTLIFRVFHVDKVDHDQATEVA